MPPDQVDALLALARLVERWGQRINLSGHRTLDAIVRGLVLEAAALGSALPELESIADLGSGAGFPGLPLAILRPGCRLTLIEARERRHHFQRSAARELALENVYPLRGRAETLEPAPHAAVVAQAMAQPAQALAWMRPWAAPGGLLVLPGSETAPQLPRVEGISHEATLRYRVPCSGRHRTLWIGHRDPG